MAVDPKHPDPDDNLPRQGEDPSSPNEGEGNRTAARAYNEATRSFVKSGKVSAASESAAHAVEGPEAEELRRAEAEGKRHSHGEDPELHKPAKQ
jgi:hypothetical protein